jgi:hypothetical protein
MENEQIECSAQDSDVFKQLQQFRWPQFVPKVVRCENSGKSPDATPGHYQYPIQPKAYAQANGLDFAQGNVVKYVTRYKQKDGVRDLLKAIDYLLDLAEYEQMGEATTMARVERLKNVLDREEGKC